MAVTQPYIGLDPGGGAIPGRQTAKKSLFDQWFDNARQAIGAVGQVQQAINSAAANAAAGGGGGSSSGGGSGSGGSGAGGSGGGNGTASGDIPAGDWGSGNPQDGLAGATGWAAAQGFTPAELNSIYDEPWRIIGLSYPDIATGGAGYSALRNYPIDPLELRMMTQGAGGILTGGQGQTDDEKAYGAADYANFLNNFYTQMGTAGGQGINTGALLSNIFGQDTSGGPAEAKTSLAQLLSSGDSSTQSRIMYNLVKSATEGGMDPLAAKAYQAAFLAALDKYGSQALTTDAESAPSLNQYLNANYGALTGGF